MAKTLASAKKNGQGDAQALKEVEDETFSEKKVEPKSKSDSLIALIDGYMNTPDDKYAERTNIALTQVQALSVMSVFNDEARLLFADAIRDQIAWSVNWACWHPEVTKGREGGLRGYVLDMLAKAVLPEIDLTEKQRAEFENYLLNKFIEILSLDKADVLLPERWQLHLYKLRRSVMGDTHKMLGTLIEDKIAADATQMQIPNFGGGIGAGLR